jgi:putative endonuclease
MKAPIGQIGETLAQAFLQKHGYVIVETNWRMRHAELDIIAQHTDILVFVEVKTRRSQTTESAFEAITPRKRERLLRSIHLYLDHHPNEDRDWRIDVIAVSLNSNRAPVIEHVQDALTW